MYFYHASASRTKVQAIHILRNQVMHMPQLLQLGQCPVGRIRYGTTKVPPADQTARPVTLPGLFVCDKCRTLDRLPAHPIAVLVAIAGNARCSAYAGTGQYQQPGVLADECSQPFESVDDSHRGMSIIIF